MRRLREVIHGIRVRTELLHRRLFLGERLSRRFVGVVRRQPDLVAQRDQVIVQRQNIGFTLAPSEITVLLVVADAHHHSQYANVNVLVFAQSAERSLRADILDFVHAILDVIRRLHLIHFELRLRPVQFREQRFKQTVALRRRTGAFVGVVAGDRCWFRSLGCRPAWRGVQRQQRRNSYSHQLFVPTKIGQ